MPTRQDILVSRYVYRTLVHDPTMMGSSAENPYRGPPPTTAVRLVSRLDQDLRLLGQQLLLLGQEY
jgi:hypothetical protein